MAAAAVAAPAVAPHHLNLAKARRKPLGRPPVALHPGSAVRAVRHRKPGIQRFQKRLQRRSTAAVRTVAHRPLDGVEVRCRTVKIPRRPGKKRTELRTSPLQHRHKTRRIPDADGPPTSQLQTLPSSSQ